MVEVEAVFLEKRLLEQLVLSKLPYQQELIFEILIVPS